MITLYIATHNKTGLKYFGKTDRFHTEKELQESYHGSGKYWKNHLNKHGDDVTMEIWYQDDNQEAVTRLALMFSETYNIVESKEWANLKPENGLDGGWDHVHNIETYEKAKITRNKNSKIKNKTYEEIYGIDKAKELKKIRSNIFKSINRSESKNSRAGIVKIFDNNNKPVFICDGNFRKICKENNLPLNALLHSYLQNGKPIYVNIIDAGNISILSKKNWLKYKGWYAIKYNKYSK